MTPEERWMVFRPLERDGMFFPWRVHLVEHVGSVSSCLMWGGFVQRSSAAFMEHLDAMFEHMYCINGYTPITCLRCTVICCLK